MYPTPESGPDEDICEGKKGRNWVQIWPEQRYTSQYVTYLRPFEDSDNNNKIRKIKLKYLNGIYQIKKKKLIMKRNVTVAYLITPYHTKAC